MNDIETVVAELRIPYLVHFTRLEHLASVIEHGILPVSRFNELPIAPMVNDADRFDGRLHGISTSIAFPNYRMFYKLRVENPEAKWVVLVLDQSILWAKRCLFCKFNAADARMSNLPEEQLSDCTNLREMFEGEDRENCLRAYDPSDPQAEVVVLDCIEPALIRAIVFNNSDDKAGSGIPFSETTKLVVHPSGKGFFAQRAYYRQWG